MAEKNELILSIRGMSKSFGRNRVLDHINLDVKPGTVMGLMGENGAGKSTMMKCLFGTYQKDEGTIFLDGKEVSFSGPKDALENGIAMVHQELNQCLERNVIDNLFLGRYPKNSVGIIDESRMKKEASELFRKLGITVNLSQPMKKMSVSNRQMCEIAKAISYNSKVIVLDEPTSSLTQNEVEALFRIVDDLKAEGVAIVYISHKMDEILRISDEVTIMRDGQYIGTWEAKELTTDMIISRMVGRELTNLYPKRENVPGEVVFSVENFTSINPKSFRNVSFELRKGEILGVGGLVGAQRTELMEGIFGTRSHTTGKITFHGKELKINRPKDAIDQGVAMLTEDRRQSGIMGVLSIADNISIASLKKYVDGGIMLNSKKIEQLVQDNVQKMNIKTPSSKTLIQSLSGGNQQKVLIGRWLANDPEVLILDEPTRGIDVGAKYEIYCIIAELAKQGKSIIMISSEMGELIGMSDRIMVMCDGKVTGFIDSQDATQESVMSLATQFS